MGTLRPTHDYVQLEQQEEVLKNGLVIPAGADPGARLVRARVVACGPKANYRPGQVVLVPPGAGIRFNGVWFVYDERRDIVAVEDE